jgi:hypothetical protein
LTNDQLEKLRSIKQPGFKAVTLPIHFDPAGSAMQGCGGGCQGPQSLV